LERRDLVQLDTELREAWGIEVGSLECPDWWERLERECPSGLVNRFVQVHRAYVAAEVDGGPENRMAESAFFDLVADERLLGRVHSHRRPVIVDTAAFVDELVMDRGITGPVLDAGCHAGYLSAWWARHAELEMVGSDLSLAALELGRRRCAALGRNVELVEADLLPGGERRDFGLIVAVDVLPEEIGSGLEGLQRLAEAWPTTGTLSSRPATQWTWPGIHWNGFSRHWRNWAWDLSRRAAWEAWLHRAVNRGARTSLC